MVTLFSALAFDSLSQSVNISICPGEAKTLNSGLGGASFKWEVNRGNGFELVLDTGKYSGATTANLEISGLTTDMSSYAYRCLGDTARTGLFTIMAGNSWVGGQSPFWEDAGNWSCGELPDSSTDVVLLSGNIFLRNNIKIKSLYVADVKLTVLNGAEILIAGLSTAAETFELLDEDLALLDSIGAENPPITEMDAFLNATGSRNLISAAADQIQKFVNRMIGFSWTLSNPKETTLFPDAGDQIINGKTIHRPAHWGYAYSFGSRQYDTRKIPEGEGADALHKEYAVTGIDCSGFLYALFHHAGLPVSKSITTNNLVAPIEVALKSTPGFTNIKIVNKGKLAQTYLRNGDIILWNGHTGIFYNSLNKGGLVYQSNGTGTPNSADKCKEYNYKITLGVDGVTWRQKDGCKTYYTEAEMPQVRLNQQLKNLGQARGIHPIKFTAAIDKAAGYWGTEYTVFRFEPFEVITVEPPTGKSTQTQSESITDSTATLSGEVLSDGGSSLLSRGICYSTTTSKKPTVFNLRKVEGNGLGSFSTTINKLLPGTKYAACAYAINQTDTAYGNTIVFDTKGNMDTVATLVAHGLWDVFFLGESENSFVNALGVLSQDRDDEECPELITNEYLTEKIQFLYPNDSSGSFRLLGYNRYWTVVSFSPCEALFPETENGWNNSNHKWTYDHPSKTIKFQYGLDEENLDYEFYEFRILSISADELTGYWSALYQGEMQFSFFMRLK